MTILPIVDIDPLLLASRTYTLGFTVNDVSIYNAKTVPPGEYWHLKMCGWKTVAGSDYSLYMFVLRPGLGGGVNQRQSVTDLWAFSGIDVRSQTLDFTLRPGDVVGWESLAFVASGGVALGTFTYDLEDCSS